MTGVDSDVVEPSETSGSARARLGAIALLARSAVRGRWASLAVVAAVAAIVSGAALTTAAGARRTATVVDRMVAEFDQPAYAVGTYLTLNAGDPALLRATEEALTDVPGVTTAIAIPNIYAAIGPDDGSWYLGIGAVLDDRYLESGWTGPLRDGRLPAVDGRNEVAFDAGTASRLGLEVGDEFVAPTISVETMAALMSGQTFDIVADGPELRFTVVGIFRESITDDPSFGYGLTSPDTVKYLGQAGVSDAWFAIDGDPGVDTAALPSAVNEALGGGSAYYADPDLGLDPTRDVVRITAIGLALFSLVAAAAGVIALGQVVGRQVADTGRLASVTSALGMQDRDTAVAVALPTTIAAGAGIVIGAIAAALLSPIFPTGQGRVAEPHPGVRVDWLVLIVGAAALLALVLLWAIVAAHRRVRHRNLVVRTVVRRRRAGLRSGLPLTAAIGSGLVLVPNRIRAGVRPTSALVGTVLGVTGVLAISVFVVSQQTTAEDPVRYGWRWDADTDITVDDPEALVAALTEEPALAAVGVVTCGDARVEDQDTLLCGLDVRSGSMPMTYLSGRPPSSPAEVAAGQSQAADLGIEIGDEVEVTGATGTVRRLELVGIVVTPDDTDPGGGLVATVDTTIELVGEASYPILLLTYAPDLERDEVEQVLATNYGLTPDELTPPSPPLLVERLDLVRPTLVALAVFLGALGAIGLLHFLLVSTVRRRQESAVLGALGFVRAQKVAVVVWQALTIAVVGMLIGAPLGVVLGRSAWVESIDHLGIVDDPTVPWRFGVVVLAVVLLGAAVVGGATGWRAARARPADLHDE